MTPSRYPYLSSDLSWLKFNQRVLEQSLRQDKTIFERVKFLAISAANLDEFFMVRVGHLYNYLDCHRPWSDRCGLPTEALRKTLFQEARSAFEAHHARFCTDLKPQLEEADCQIVHGLSEVDAREREQLARYFKKAVFPMLTPMVFDSHHAFPVLMNRVLILAVATSHPDARKACKKISFIQLPKNLPKFYPLKRHSHTVVVPIEEIVKTHLPMLFRNVEICSTTLFRVVRNGDFSLTESDDVEASFVEEFKRKLKKRRQGRVVRLEISEQHDPDILACLQSKWQIDQDNLFWVPTSSLMDLTRLQQIAQQHGPDFLPPVPPLSYDYRPGDNLFEVLKTQDVLLHHPYNSIDIVLDFIERAAEDPCVLVIKMTVYRLAKDSAVVAALLKAAECGKHVSVMVEIQARFDEENNMRVAQMLEQAGCFVVYGLGHVKTHAKMMMIVRQEDKRITRYVHLSSGNYNEDTAKVYTDMSLLTTDEGYAHDVSEFFNAITGHSLSEMYQNLITAPTHMRKRLVEMIEQEARCAQEGLASGIVIKVNALADEAIIDALYKASQAGVSVRLIVRGICCLIPQHPSLSQNITVRSIVGSFLEHTRLFYFHNRGTPHVYVGSADIMVRSFDKRIEALFSIKQPFLQQEVINALAYNLKDTANSYCMQSDGSYTPMPEGDDAFDLHRALFYVTPEKVKQAKLFH